jgi:hypothetical protein
MWLANHLREYGMKSETLRIGARIANGYALADFAGCSRGICDDRMSVMDSEEGTGWGAASKTNHPGKSPEICKCLGPIFFSFF